MSVVLSVYSQSAYKEFVLPAIHNAETVLVIDRRVFHLKDSIELRLEEMDGNWTFLQSSHYEITENSETDSGSRLKDQATYILKSEQDDYLPVIVQMKETSFTNYIKYDISNIGEITVGSKDTANICYSYRYADRQYISKRHLILRRTGNGIVLKDTSTNGVFVNDIRVDKEKKLVFGDQIHLWGLDMVFLGNILAVRKGKNLKVSDRIPEWNSDSLRISEDEEKKSEIKIYHRAPRNLQELETGEIVIEDFPDMEKQQENGFLMAAGPAMVMAVPSALNCIMAVTGAGITGIPMEQFMHAGMAASISSVGIGAAWIIYNIIHDRFRIFQSKKSTFKRYEEYLEKCEKEIRQKYIHNVEALEEMYPSAGECVSADFQNQNRMWNRNSTHKDFLLYRLGKGEIPFQVDIQIPKERFQLTDKALVSVPGDMKGKYQYLHNVPICLDLSKERMIGITGGKDLEGAYPVVRELVAQIAAQNCYTDVKMGFAYQEEQGEKSDRWGFARWLPHTWAPDKKIRYVASDKNSASDIFYELTKVLRMRREKQKTSEKQENFCKPYYILFVEKQEYLDGELLANYIYDEEANLGFTVVLLAEQCEDLPNSCECIIQNDEQFSGRYDVRTGKRTPIIFDEVSRYDLDKMARRQADIEVKEVEVGSEVPEQITFMEMYKVSQPKDLHIEERWKKNRTYRSMKALIGQKAGGTDCYLDVHEKYHGPHGLIAGTTGSGKSEILQTYMLSLAVNFSPDDVAFLIIDYKGGGMAKLFEGMPHIVGKISNLSGSQVHRAMVSIKSENRRRQRLFNKQGVNHIDAYTILYKNGETDIPLPHLFIIVDEFAELKREEEGFLKELISVAQVGRSLGVHLILATQKPEGTVDENIWSNSRFRICLRVQDSKDSMYMLHKADAAYLTQTGRAYLQIGNNEIYELFQSGWSGASYDENDDINRTHARMLDETGRAALVGNYAKRRTNETGQNFEIKNRTQLDVTVKYLAQAAEREGYRKPQQLWLPVLSESITLENLMKYTKELFNGQRILMDSEPSEDAVNSKNIIDGKGIQTIIGLWDDPENQEQKPLVLDFTKKGNYAVCGMPMSGRSTLLQTTVYGLIHRYTPEELNIYILDFSNKILGIFEGEAHIGGILYENDDDGVERFFHMLEQMLDERKELFGGGNYQQYAAIHTEKYPAVLIVIDNLAGFREKTEFKYDEKLIRISRECASYGIYMIITGSGMKNAEFPMRMRDNFHQIICLELPDRIAYGECLGSMKESTLPEQGIRGRGLVQINGRNLEFQTALAVAASDDYQRGEKIRKECAELNKNWSGRPARQIPKIPQNPEWNDFQSREDVQKYVESDRYLPVGYDTVSAEIFSLDLSKMYCFLISGKSRTGKHNCLKIMMNSAKQKGGELVVVEFNGWKLKKMAEDIQALYIDSYEKYMNFMSGFVPVFQSRNRLKKSLMNQGMDEEQVYAQMCREKPYYIFIADLAEYTKIMHSEQGIKDNLCGAMANLFEKGFLHNIYFFACMNQDQRTDVMGKDVFEKFISGKAGIHMGGNVAAQRILEFTDMPFGEQTRSEKPGIGILASANGHKYRRIVIPLVKGTVIL